MEQEQTQQGVVPEYIAEWFEELRSINNEESTENEKGMSMLQHCIVGMNKLINEDSHFLKSFIAFITISMLTNLDSKQEIIQKELIAMCEELVNGKEILQNEKE